MDKSGLRSGARNDARANAARPTSYLEQVRDNASRQPASRPKRPAGRFVERNGKRPPHFWQGASPWGTRLLNDDETLSKAGCAITSVGMALCFLGRDVNPGDVDAHMDRNGGYSKGSDGIGDWNIALAAGAGNGQRVTLQRSFRLYNGDDEAQMRTAIRDSLMRNIPVIARLNYPQRDASGGVQHFALIVGHTADGFVMNEPALSNGNGAADPSLPDVVIETATRNGGMRLVGADILSIG
jgi:hypothetical protein